MGSRYRLTYVNGDDAGDAELPDSVVVRIGDEVHTDNNEVVRVTKVVLIERIAEFVDGAIYGLLEVELADRPPVVGLQRDAG